MSSVLVFTPTPFDARTLKLDVKGFRENVEFLAANKIGAIAIAGFVGEYSALTGAEYDALVRAARDGFGEDGLIIAGVGVGAAQAAEHAAIAERSGADGIMILPPYLVEPTNEGIVSYVRTVSEATRLQLMVSHDARTRVHA